MGRTSKKTLTGTALAVTAAAVAGGLGTDPRSSWYHRLRKPSWQPPRQAYGLVWTPLYATIAYASARALSLGDERSRPALRRALAANLALNAAWPPLFFKARSPRLALAELVALNASNVLLTRRFLRQDRAAGLLLLPYTGWTLFATALNASIARRNPPEKA
ncbi:TspO/MBR family protein [Microbispora amethystogenes]|uniref:Sensory protein TspO n=1 Tax=Microbispora amethystogenes TaxID=1427754 RepID=A0ABQ4FKF7_9ACTN|nr:TspO/MBR family protein [Microbispora amethystogenes]GIH35290.1 sensory protein TspO [Microbispora amethystogenes]